MFKFRTLSKFIYLVLAAYALPANACLHLDEDEPVAPAPTSPPSSYPANETEGPSIVQALTTHKPKEYWHNLVAERRTVAEKEWDFRTQNNLSVALAHTGQLDEALERMQTVERTFPGHPYTAYNLGTVYELKGDLSKALEWVNKGIKREKERTGTHHLNDTEWLHIRILETEVKSKSDPDTLKSTSVLGLDFGKNKMPVAPTKLPTDLAGNSLTLAEVENSLFRQLHERLEFVPAPNPIVADLLFDYANIQTLKTVEITNPSTARELYQMSLDYGAAQHELVKDRFDYFEGSTNYLPFWGFISIAICAAAWWQWKRNEKLAWQQIEVEQLDEVAPPKKPVYIDFSKYDSNDKE
jgi:hypothetical protein